MKIKHSLRVGLGVTLFAILGVVLLAFIMLSSLAGQWSEMSTVINKRHQLMMKSSLHLGYATLHFTNFVRDGGNSADRCLRELNSVGDAVTAYQSTGPLSAEEQVLLDNASHYIGLYREDLHKIMGLRASQTDTAELQFAVQAENDKLLAMVIRKLTDLTNNRTDRAAEEINKQIQFNRAGLLLAALAAAAAVITTGILAARSIIQHDAERNRALHSLEIEIVEHRKAQEELVRKEKLAILGRMSGSVGHELRNPLGVMNNAVYFLKMILAEADETTKEYLDIIQHEIDNSQRIITDMLDFARTKTPQIKAMTARALLDDSLGRCTLPENVALQTEIPDNLPLIRVDPLQMGQVLQNLISNAVQAMPDGGALRVTARLAGAIQEPLLQNPKQETGDFIQLSVTDTGEGISPENMSKLFQPLFTTKAKGIGLGLVVCKNLVEANGGRVEVESEPGKGTTFTVALPVERPEM